MVSPFLFCVTQTTKKRNLSSSNVTIKFVYCCFVHFSLVLLSIFFFFLILSFLFPFCTYINTHTKLKQQFSVNNSSKYRPTNNIICINFGFDDFYGSNDFFLLNTQIEHTHIFLTLKQIFQTKFEQCHRK